MTDFLTRLTELAGADVTATLVAEWGGQQLYFPKPGAPATGSPAPSFDDIPSTVFWMREQAHLQLDQSFKRRMAAITAELLCSSGEAHRVWIAEAQLCCQLFLDAYLLFAQLPLTASPQSTQS